MIYFNVENIFIAGNNANDVTIATATVETPELLQDTVWTQQIQPDTSETVSFIFLTFTVRSSAWNLWKCR